MTRSTGATMGTLALIVFLRVLGAFLVLVGFGDHWVALGGSRATIGIGFAAYLVALAIFLLPLGILSDRIGRRNVMVAALLISALGGVLAAYAPNAILFAAGRFIQGIGAVNGVALAVAGEIGEPEKRTRRMAVLGAAAGGGVVLGLLSSAILTRLGVGIPALLLGFSAATALTIPLVWSTVPEHGAARREGTPAPLARGKVLMLSFGAFAVNFALSGLLLYSKPMLANVAPNVPYEVALLAMLLPGGLGMFLTSRLADKGHARAIGIASATLLGIAPLAFLWPMGAAVAIAAGILFFLGHSSLTSLIPSLVSRVAGEGRRGTAQGIQSTLQYLGSAAGTSVVGILFAAGLTIPLAVVFVACGVGVGLVVAASGEGS